MEVINLSRISEITINTFEEFQQKICNMNTSRFEYQSFVYRGQAKDWELLPKAHRVEEKKKIEEYSDYKKDTSEIFYISAEDNLLFEFYNLSKRNGLRVPTVPQYDFRHSVSIDTEDFIRARVKEWYPKNLVELAALAQHNGVPTRLIDRSFDVNSAIYFAALKAIELALTNGNKYVSDYIVIWVFDLNNFDLFKSVNNPNDIPFNFIVPNYYNNTNLNAQSGILSYWECKDLSRAKEIVIEPFDTRIEKFNNKNRGTEFLEEILKKVKIPAKESVKIAKYLYNTGYSAAKMFPGYSGVIKAIEEKKMIIKASMLLCNL